MTTLAGDLAATVLTLVGLVVTAGGAVLAAWAALKANNPKLRLGYRLHSSAELLADHGSSGLSVTHNGTALTSPHVASVQIVNQGRRDIVSAMFHNGDPVEFDLGEPILALLGTESSPSSSHAPSATVSGSKLLVPPSHVRRKQRITYTVLLDGPVAGLGTRHSLVNVDVREAGSDDKLGCTGWLIFGVLTALAVTLVGIAFTMILPNAWVAWLQDLDNRMG
ncbi:hypothetical protein GCM10019016_072830 [Streptomyces prasinosporus]|uniref:Uncharacterized protein n=1 Tax=Streptomyces prasinosporus TaxID=68256 RepID=A0ABP6TXU2_9ACTN